MEENTTLLDWLSTHPSDDWREVFINIDIALKYLHTRDYCVEVFHPSKITLLNGMIDHVRFDHIMPIDKNSMSKSKITKEDIFNSALIQIGMYTNTLKYLSPSFLKEKFDDIARFLPEGDVPYYRGVIQRGASVYFSDFALEKMHRDYDNLEKQLSEETGEKNVPTSNSLNRDKVLENDSINDKIYKQISGNEAAFASSIIIPGIILITVIVLLFLIVLLRM